VGAERGRHVGPEIERIRKKAMDGSHHAGYHGTVTYDWPRHGKSQVPSEELGVGKALGDWKKVASGPVEQRAASASADTLLSASGVKLLVCELRSTRWRGSIASWLQEGLYKPIGGQSSCCSRV